MWEPCVKNLEFTYSAIEGGSLLLSITPDHETQTRAQRTFDPLVNLDLRVMEIYVQGLKPSWEAFYYISELRGSLG